MTATAIAPATAIAIHEAQLETYAELRDPFLFRRARTWWTLLALFLMADGGGIFTKQGTHPDAVTFIGGGAGNDQSQLSVQIISGAMWVICGLLAYGHLRPALELMRKQKAAVGFVLFALVSRFWSHAPGITTSKSLMLFLYLLFTWFFATYYKPADQMRLLMTLGFIMGVASVIWAVLLPQYGLHATGEWKGIFGQKNLLGSAMVFLFSAIPFYPVHNFRRIGIMLLQAIVPIGLILLSQSRTSLIMSFLLVVIRVTGPLMTRMRKQSLPFMLYFLGGLIAMVPFVLIVVLPLLGRDLTLTGRTHIWAMLFPFAMSHVWLGWGYQAFFLNASREFGPIIFGAPTGPLFSVDNGYLDIMLQCGIVGVVLVLSLLFTSMRDFYVLLRRPSVQLATFWYAALVHTLFLGSITENMLWKPIRLVPFVLAFGSAGLSNLRYRFDLPSPPPASAPIRR